jgi:sulfur-oxidizing protein SoxY
MTGVQSMRDVKSVDTRRRTLLCVAAVTLLPTPLRAQAPVPEEDPQGILKVPAIASFLNGRVPKWGKVTLDVPRIAENGNSLPMAVDVESPMTAADHVKMLHVYSEKNPRRMIAAFRFGPDSPRAAVESRIRLANSQRVAAFAEMADGSLWWGGLHVVVTISSCIDGS